MVTTPFGLYEWTVIPQGLKNAPPIHQQWMNWALCEHIGKFCHVCIDDIVIWSDSIDEHKQHINIIMEALKNVKLFCNKKKGKIFLLELDFLGHHISACQIEANTSKVQQILDWPTPQNSTDIQTFLGLVHYLVYFLLELVEQT